MELYITLGIIIIGVFLFVREYFSIDTTSLLIMAMFIVSGVLNPTEGFSGFIHPATLTLGCLFVISAAIFKSGIIDGLSKWIIILAKKHYIAALIVFSLTTALFSAFINDSAVVAIMIPMALVVCNETGIKSSKLLIPISFAACFGGACTLIGTGTNVLITSYAEESGLPKFGMFEFTLAALVLLGIGLLYLFFIAPLLLPGRDADGSEKTLVQEAETYTAEITLLPGGSDVNKKISQTRLVRDHKVQILLVNRGSEQIHAIYPDLLLQPNDVLKVLISPDHLLQLKSSKGYVIQGDKTFSDFSDSGTTPDTKSPVSRSDVRRVYEVLVPVGSTLAGNSLMELNFRNVYSFSVIAVRHRDETIMQNLRDVILKEGDMLLVYATENELKTLTSKRLLFVLSNYEQKKVEFRKAFPAIAIAVAVVMSAALNLTSILMSGMIGCLLLVTGSILKPEEAYKSIEWKVIFMLAGVLSMGKALEKTGGSEIAAQFIFNSMGGFGPNITLSLIFLVTFLATNILSGKATAALMAPVVISLSSTMGISERPFLVTVMFACAFTFMTPVANPTNSMVYAAGNYKYKDFLRVGTPLNFIIWIAASFIIPWFFPF